MRVRVFESAMRRWEGGEIGVAGEMKGGMDVERLTFEQLCSPKYLLLCSYRLPFCYPSFVLHFDGILLALLLCNSRHRIKLSRPSFDPHGRN